jgi:hypothetical protein
LNSIGACSDKLSKTIDLLHKSWNAPSHPPILRDFEFRFLHPLSFSPKRGEDRGRSFFSWRLGGQKLTFARGLMFRKPDKFSKLAKTCKSTLLLRRYERSDKLQNLVILANSEYLTELLGVHLLPAGNLG